VKRIKIPLRTSMRILKELLNYTKNYSPSLPLGNTGTEESKPARCTCKKKTKRILYAIIVLWSSTRMICNPQILYKLPEQKRD
jgi:hypothetical protein